MGLVWARLEEERNELNVSRRRAAQYLERFRPDYITDDRLVGLAPDAIGVQDIEMPPVPEIMGTASGSHGLEADGEDTPGGKRGTSEDRKTKVGERMIQDHLRLLQGAARGSRWTVLQMGRCSHVRMDQSDTHGRTALFLAAENGHVQSLDALIGFRARIDQANKNGWTPLHAATFHGHLRCMVSLLTEKASVNAQEKHGCTPLIFAASSPKLYLLDFVSRTDRQKRQKVRVDAFRQQKVLLESHQTRRSLLQGFTKKDATNQTERVDPAQIWKYYPNRIELMVLEELLSQKNVQVDMADHKRRTPLIYAARYGHIHSVSRLLYAKANFRIADASGRTALFHAACNQHADIVDMLLRAGGSVNMQDQFFKTPLHGALEAGDEGMATLLLEAQASVQAYDCEGRTPIMMAMDQHNRRLFAAIVERGCSLDVLDKRGWNVVIYAIEKGMLNEVMPLLIKLGNRVHRIIRDGDPQGRNAVHHAAQLHNAQASDDALRKLLRLDPDAAALGDCNGNTAFHMVAELGRLQAIRTLIDKIPQADFLNNMGETPLHHAAHSGHLACVVTLIQDVGSGPTCNAAAVDSHGWNLLMHACTSGHLDLVNLLLQNKDGKHPDLKIPPLDVNDLDQQGVNALSIAAREGHWHLLPSLVLADANCSAKDKDGFTALHWAVLEDEPLALSCLLDLGLDPNVRDSKYWTPLMHAVTNGCDEALRVLLDGGADMDARNWDGDTALQLCLRRKDKPERVQVTKDILTDGMLDLDCRPRCSIAATGHFMVSVISASGLYLEGRVGEVNAYVCLQFRTQASSVPQVAFTSCTLQNPMPEWHEVFRFDTERLDPTACLVAWVIAAPGDTAEEVVEGAERGLGEKELRRFKLEEQLAGQRARRPQPEFTTALQASFKRLTRRAEIAEDIEVDKLRRLAIAHSSGVEPTSDLVVLKPQQIQHRSLEERRWNEVANLRKLLERSGCPIDEPLVPRSHLPMGCVVIRFRHLRAAVWGTEPVEIDRTLRLGCRGSLRVEVDFRPRFFVARQQHGDTKMSSQDEDPITVRPLDMEFEMLELDEELHKPTPEGFHLEEKPVLSVEEQLAAASGEKHKSDAEVLFRRFMQVTQWSRMVLDVRNKLGPNPKPGYELLQHTPPPQGSLFTRSIRHVLQRAQAPSDARAMQQEILDKPVGTTVNFSRPAMREATVQPDASMPMTGVAGVQKPLGQQKALPKLPLLKAEPWLEELLDGTRLF